MNIKTGLVALALAAALAAPAAAAWEPAYAVVGCRVVPVSGAPLEDAVIVIRGGLIEAVGPRAGTHVPEDAEVVDGKGLTAYPGLIDAFAAAFVQVPPEPKPDPGELFGSVSPANSVGGRTPEFAAFDHLAAGETEQAAARRSGILTVLAVPRQRMFSGRSALLNLNGGSPAEMVVRNPAALHVEFTGGRGSYPTTGMGVQALFRQLSLDAARYRTNAEMASGRGVRRPVYDPFLEALSPYLLDKGPVVFSCDGQEEIKNALRLVSACRVRGLVAGANEAWRVADALKASGLPVLLSLNFAPPATSLYAGQGKEAKEKAEKEIYPANAAKLKAAGIAFAFTSFGLEKGADLLAQVRKAVQAGLAEDEALRALTIHPARFLGVDGQLGTLEPGKIANVVLAGGDLLKEGTRVRLVFVDGRRFEIKDDKAGSAAPPVAGRWKGTVTGLPGLAEVSFELALESGVVSGKVAAGGESRDIRDGKAEDDTITFAVTLRVSGAEAAMTFKGKMAGGKLEGELSGPPGKGALKAERVPDAPAPGGAL
jgi:imidazolonepropionase-like amidohydrolase